jgi:hypothetical protein
LLVNALAVAMHGGQEQERVSPAEMWAEIESMQHGR